MSKVDRAIHGPGWGEVILGAVLSFVLGVAIGAMLLIVKPVVVTKESPKEPIPGKVYYTEGLRGDQSKAQQALAKRKALLEGQSITVTEDEINALAVSLTAPKPAAKPAAKPDEKAAAAPATPADKLETGTPNVRIREGVMQVGVPVTLNIFGLHKKLIAQARGGFEKQGDRFVYDPSEIYLGSCPIQRLPILPGYIRSKVLESVPVPDDIAQGWSKLASVSIEGNALKLSVQ